MELAGPRLSWGKIVLLSDVIHQWRFSRLSGNMCWGLFKSVPQETNWSIHSNDIDANITILVKWKIYPFKQYPVDYYQPLHGFGEINFRRNAHRVFSSLPGAVRRSQVGLLYDRSSSDLTVFRPANLVIKNRFSRMWRCVLINRHKAVLFPCLNSLALLGEQQIINLCLHPPCYCATKRPRWKKASTINTTLTIWTTKNDY